MKFAYHIFQNDLLVRSPWYRVRLRLPLILRVVFHAPLPVIVRNHVHTGLKVRLHIPLIYYLYLNIRPASGCYLKVSAVHDCARQLNRSTVTRVSNLKWRAAESKGHGAYVLSTHINKRCGERLCGL